MGAILNAVLEYVSDAEGLTAERLSAANIHPVTRLATDYLNHFNEVVMLLEMLPQMPDCAEDVLAWEPLTYPQHFEASGFKDRDLAIRAYYAAPPAARVPFDATIEDVDRYIIEAQRILTDGDASDPAVHEQIVLLVTTELKPLIARASGIVNGTGATAPLEADLDGASTQDAVDALFD